MLAILERIRLAVATRLAAAKALIATYITPEPEPTPEPAPKVAE